MATHQIGPFKVEVLHEEHCIEKRVDVLIVVYEGREFLDLVRFDFKGFNSGELRKKIPSLSAFHVQQLKAVIDDAREWPKDETCGKEEPRTERPKANRSQVSRRSRRKRG